MRIEEQDFLAHVKFFPGDHLVMKGLCFILVNPCIIVGIIMDFPLTLGFATSFHLQHPQVSYYNF